MTVSRRLFLASSGLATASTLLPSVTASASSNAANSPLSSTFGGLIPERPALTHGVASGDVRPDGALIWTRADRPSRMVVEVSPTDSFHNARRFTGTVMSPETDHTGKLRLVGLNTDSDVHYRVFAQDLDTGLLSEPVLGTFRTAPSTRRNIRFQWSGDVAGQGYGINPDLGGWTAWSQMAQRNPDFFIHSGDTIYADNKIEESVTLPDGRIWRNVVTEAKSRVAQSLEDYRGNYAYNLMDSHYRQFNSHVPQIVQWDDHETVNNWYPDEVLDLPDYRVKDVNTLAGWAHQAFHEWQPTDQSMAVDGRIYRKISYGPMLDIFVLDMRSYKDDNSLNHRGTKADGHILGAQQEAWLIRELQSSTATWKVVANDLPLGIIVPDGKEHQEGVASGTPGAPVGRESEIALVLHAIREVRNVVWLTADVHYTAAHHYHPDRAAFQEFSPFWEFVSGPLQAGAFGPNEMDSTFGPEVVYAHAPEQPNTSPLDEFQHFGEVDIDGQTQAMTVKLLTTQGTELYKVTLSPQ
ncbi:alkaline phosphatase D family protein [Corynebacterium lowii]|uniref:Alkaline phosphatase D n=1 Tax=Corynebacterium lowii TaxID=1544413 RepID=A0A0Q0YIU1_9CORY|nr:alkaline phosphatase D family protein [Corynebacterium lowii]KQB86663.1 Alkaline phosphatase D precursor [Corynebacterium lowii]MDP9851348.1 alkaline phosphatase D [Corynebacterium lowii]